MAVIITAVIFKRAGKTLTFFPNYLVYVFIGENWALLDFIDIMNDRNLFAKGEYVVLAIDNSIDDVSDNQVQI